MDAELLKIVLQAGSFGVLVVMALYGVMVFMPRQEARQDAKDQKFLDALTAQERQHREAENESHNYWNEKYSRLEDKIDDLPATVERRSRG